MSCPTALLIDIKSDQDQNASHSESEVTEKPLLSSPNTAVVEHGSTSIIDNKILESSASMLCGYLTKISNSGILKTSKTRWFTFHSDTCELYYYRSNTETVNNSPLGKIALRRASFNFTAGELKENIFTITADGVSHSLQAHDKKSLSWWLQELQTQRRNFIVNDGDDAVEPDEWHGTMLGQSLFWVANSNKTNSGLLTNDSKNRSSSLASDSQTSFNILPRINEAPDSIAIKPNEKHRTLSILSSSSFSSISNKLAGIGGINTALLNAGETLKSHASRLKPTNQSKILSHNQDFVELSDSSFAANEKLAEMCQELSLMQDKLQSKEEAVQLLKLELEKFEQLKDFQEKQHTFSRDDYKLRSEVITLKLDKERLEEEKAQALVRENELQERMLMLEEMLVVKDEVVVQLSNRVYELESKLNSLESDYDKLKQEKNEEFFILTPTDAEESLSSLKDRVEGYLFQNQLLNNEILELANLRQHDARKIQKYCDKIQQNEAEHCQLHSKYLVLLSEMNKPRTESVGLAVAGTKLDTSNEDRKEMLKILIKDALTDAGEEASESIDGGNGRDRYDRFGFNNLPDDDTESTLLSAASQLEKRSTDILQSLHKFKVSVAIKWQNYLTINKELQMCDEVKELIRLGVPHELRAQVWSWMIKMSTALMRQKTEFGSSYYRGLVNNREAPLSCKQIELDLLRTLPNNKHFSSLSSSGIQQLRQVLRAYSIHNPTVGYCQGLNRVAAVALLYLSEEEAFWCVVAIVECIMPPDYYSNTLSASQADQRVFRDLMAEKLPRLHKHLETAGIDTSLITFNWLLCIYCDNVPPDTMLHIWDCLLYEGSKVLFRFGLAFFKLVEDEILQLTDYMAIFNFLRTMSHRMHDVRELNRLAFSWMNPFPMRKIMRLRQFHQEKVAAELKELDKLRKGFSGNRREVRRELDSDDD